MAEVINSPELRLEHVLGSLLTREQMEQVKPHLAKVKDVLVCTLEDCYLALSDKWDRSNDGFEAMETNINGLFEILPEWEDEEPGECEILCDENRGIYIPKAFAEMYGHMLVDEDGNSVSEDEEVKDILRILLDGPDNEHYWDAMVDIERGYNLKMNGKIWDIEQNGDLWAYEHGKRRPEGHDGE